VYGHPISICTVSMFPGSGIGIGVSSFKQETSVIEIIKN
jgi:hypothetical protein